MTTNSDFIEQRIIEAVRFLLAGRVNEILRESEFTIPVIEFGDYYGLRLLRLKLRFLVANGRRKKGLSAWTLIP